MDANIGVTMFTSAGVAVWAIQQLKNASWFPLLQHGGQVWTKRILSIATALGVHTGISSVWEPAQNAGWHTLTLTIPPATVLLVGLGHWLSQYVMQEGWYQVAYNRLTLTSSPEAPAVPMKVTAEGQVVVPKP